MTQTEQDPYFGEAEDDIDALVAQIEDEDAQRLNDTETPASVIPLDKPHPIFIPKPKTDAVEESLLLAVRSFEEELEHFDGVMDKTTAVRNVVISKLATAVDGIVSLDMSDSDNVNNTLSVMNVTLKALADQEASATKRIGAKRAYENQRRGSAASAAIVDMFRNIAQDRTQLESLDLSKETRVLEAEFEEHDAPIMTTELSDDPQDVV